MLLEGTRWRKTLLCSLDAMICKILFPPSKKKKHRRELQPARLPNSGPYFSFSASLEICNSILPSPYHLPAQR